MFGVPLSVMLGFAAGPAEAGPARNGALFVCDSVTSWPASGSVAEPVIETAVFSEPLTVAEKGLAQAWKTQQRLPWVHKNAPPDQLGKGLNAVVLGAGPIGILGAMALVANGFKTYVYSRMRKPNPKAALVESIGATYISAETETPDQLAEVDVALTATYAALGRDVLTGLGALGLVRIASAARGGADLLAPIVAFEVRRRAIALRDGGPASRSDPAPPSRRDPIRCGSAPSG